MIWNNEDKTDRLLCQDGFCDAEQMVFASREAYRELSGCSMGKRREIIAAIKERMIPLVPQIAEMEFKHTGMGNVKDKIVKLMLAIGRTPGTEDLVTEATTGDEGMTLYEYASYGVLCTILPGTNPCATLISNTISILASGNSVIHIPNPRCVEETRYVAGEMEKAAYEVCGIHNLICAVSESSMQQAEEIMNHPDVALVVATGGARMLHHALSCTKRVIGAGPANPVAIVDATADLKKAARDIFEGAAFDHNIMCISEKNLVVEESVADALVSEFKQLGVHYIHDEDEMLKLTKAVVTSELCMNRALEGRSAPDILAAAGIPCGNNVRLIIVDTRITHPLFSEEFLMPILSMVRVEDFEEALSTALFIEQGYRHTAMIHSQSIDHLNRAAHELQTSIFIKNGSSLEAIGVRGEHNASFTIANITGEGVTTARTFARRRRCTLTTGFTIR